MTMSINDILSFTDRGLKPEDVLRCSHRPPVNGFEEVLWQHKLKLQYGLTESHSFDRESELK